MLTDLRFALRQLLKSPGFTLLAVITLTLGIGLNTAIFSLINDLFLRSLPFKDPGRLVHFYSWGQRVWVKQKLQKLWLISFLMIQNA